MAKPEASTKSAPSRPKFGLRDLWRVALWGLSAGGALFIALYAGTTEMGRDRLRTAFVEIHEILIPSGVKPIQPLDAREGRRLAETVRVLAADRERLIARIDTLEHSVEDITGSTARARKTAPTAPDEPTATAQPPGATADDVTSSVTLQSGVPMPPMPPSPPPSANAGKTEYGLDLGSAPSIEALRTAWAAAVLRNGPLLEGLHPLVQMRERPRPAAMELRLIAGPLPNAATAARLCATMTAAGMVCAPAVFDGQRLAAR